MSPHNVVRRKSIRCGDLGNGKIRGYFAWGVEEINFFRYFEGGGHKKGGFFRLIFSASKGIRVLAPDGRAAEFCARPQSIHPSGPALGSGLFFIAACKNPCVKGLCKRRPSRPNSPERISDRRAGARFNEKCPPKFSQFLLTRPPVENFLFRKDTEKIAKKRRKRVSLRSLRYKWIL